ncbi:MAG: GNAT family N-acyltransferase, partial [Rhodospirillales bacterium]
MNMLAKLAVPKGVLPKFAYPRRKTPAPLPPRPVDVRARNLEIRLAETPEEVEAAQRLRYNVFYREMGAIPTVEAARHERDADPFDAVCDHLLVLDTDRSQPGRPFVCGTYRLIRGAVAKAHGADEAIDYSKDSLKEAAKALTDGKGADVIYDPVGGDLFDQATRAINWNGR